MVLVATSADPSWTALPLWTSFPGLLQEIVAWCAHGQLQQRNVSVGEPLEVPVATSDGEVPLSIETPDGRRHRAQLRASGDYSALNYADTAQSGIYVARLGPPVNRSHTFAVNVDTTESDLTSVDPEELRTDVWPGIPFEHQTSWQELGPAMPGRPIAGRSRLHVDLLYAVLGMLFLDTFLGWRLGARGLRRSDE